MGEKRNALAFEGTRELGLSQQPVYSEQGHGPVLTEVRGEANGIVEVGLVPSGCAIAQ